VELLTAAHQSAKNSNPEAMIGFSVENYDLEFLDEALNSGAGNDLLIRKVVAKK